MVPKLEDGLRARLSCYAAAATFAFAVPPTVAREDFSAAVMGFDPTLDLGLRPAESRPSWPDRAHFPGFDTLPSPGIALTGGFDNLLRRDGPGTEIDAAEAGAGARLRIDPLPGLSLHSAWERSRLVRRVGDTGLSVNQGSTAWEGRTVVAFPLSPALIPSAGLAWSSDSDREHALLGFGLRGAAGRGLAWSLATGRRNQDLPFALDLPEYRTMTVPFQLRQDFHGFAVTARRGPAELGWTGRLLLARRPGHQGSLYGISDSGSVSEQALRIGFGGATGRPWKAEASLISGSGRHHFKGRTETVGGRITFGYLEVLQRSLAARGDGRMDFGAWRAYAWAGASAVEWNAYRPVSVAGKVFWDRNAVLDSYEGNILGVFNRETWLLDGDMRYFRLGGGGAVERRPQGPARAGRWETRLGLDWQRLFLEARSHITKRTDVGILARRTEEIESGIPAVSAHLLIPSLRASLGLSRRFTLRAEASQAIPFAVETEGGTGSGGGEGDRSGPWSGGTRAALEFSFAFGVP